MDAAHGAAAPALSKLSSGIREYSLFQGVLRVLDRLRAAHPELDEEALYERLEFQANPSLGFPGSDTDRLEFFEEHGELRARLRINLVGLFGAGSPLPAFYSEQALGDGPDGNTTRDFLDLFNDRLQRLLLPIWRKYRYYAHYDQGARDLFSARLFALIGLGGERLRAAEDLNWRRLLPYLGLLSLRAHSAALVESVLRYYFKHADLRIEQCVERRVEIIAEQRNRLGLANSQQALGDATASRATLKSLTERYPQSNAAQVARQRLADREREQAIMNEMVREPTEKRIRGLTTPTLIMWGQLDRVVSSATVPVLQKLLPQAKVVVFDGTWPFQGFLAACRAYRHPLKLVWSNRGLLKENGKNVPVDESLFDLIIVRLTHIRPPCPPN